MYRASETVSEVPDPSNDQEPSNKLREAEPPRILSNRDRDIFLALLDADPEPTEAAREAAVRFNKGWHDGEAYHFQTPSRASDTGDASDS